MPIDGSRCIRRPGGGIDFDDHAALLRKRPRDVLGHHVDAGHVQADRLGGIDRVGRHRRMDPLGDVDRRAAGAQIGVPAHEHGLAGRRDRLGPEPLVGQHRQGDGVELDLAQHRGMVLAAAGIGVGLLDQFA